MDTGFYYCNGYLLRYMYVFRANQRERRRFGPSEGKCTNYSKISALLYNVALVWSKIQKWAILVISRASKLIDVLNADLQDYYLVYRLLFGDRRDLKINLIYTDIKGIVYGNYPGKTV